MSRSIPPDIVTYAQASQRKWRVPASVSIAQWEIESGWGAHVPAGSNNPFGIKARVRNGVVIDPYVNAATNENNFKGQANWRGAQPFRKFASLQEAFDYHAQLIATAPVYAAAMAKLPDVSAFVDEMAKHYATAPNYASAIKGQIAAGKLHRFDVA